MPRSEPRPNSTAWIRLPPASARISLTSLLVMRSASVRKKTTSGLRPERRAEGQHVVGAAVGADGSELVLDPPLVGRRGRHQPLLPAGVGEDAHLEVVEDHREPGVRGRTLRLARSSRLATSSEFRVAMLPEQSMT